MIGVVAHQSRTRQAHALHDKVGAAYMCMDDGTLGCEANHRRAWQKLSRNPTLWALVLEDDAVPINNFPAEAEKALQAAPTPIVSLYRGHHVNNPECENHGLRASQRADTADAHWIVADNLLHAVAVAVHTELVPAMLDHIAELPPRFPIDEAISHYARSINTKVCYTWPSLVDHADTESVILKHHRRDKLPRPKGRTAYRTGTRPVWTSETVNL